MQVVGSGGLSGASSRCAATQCRRRAAHAAGMLPARCDGDTLAVSSTSHLPCRPSTLPQVSPRTSSA